MDEDKYIIRIRGMPWSAKPKDIMDFFSDCEIPCGEKGIHMITNAEGRPNGEAYVEMATIDDVERAKEKNMKNMGDRYIEVFTSSASEMEWVKKRCAHGKSGGDAVCRLRGLPFQCSKEEIAHFFSGLEIAPNGIVFIQTYDPRDPNKGRNSGDGFVQFASPDIAEKALEKDKQRIGKRFIEIFQSSLAELRKAVNDSQRMKPPMQMGRPGPYDRMDRYMGGGGGGGGGGSGSSGMGGGMGGGYMSRGRGRGNIKPYREFSGYYDKDYGMGDGFMGNSGGGMGNRRSGPGGNMGVNRSGRFSSGMGSSGGGGGGSSGGSGGGSGMGMSSGSNRGSPGHQYLSRTGHHVHMRGLPFSASEVDIKEFFKPVHPVCVELEFIHNGRTNGEANVDFATHEDAKLAMKKDRKMMGPRYIELFLHSMPGGSSSGGGWSSMNNCMDNDGMGGNGFGNNDGGMGGGNFGRSNMGNFFGSSGMSGGGGGMGGGNMGGGGFSGGGGGMGMGNNYTAFS